jgi:hypothetical protein
MGSKPVHAAWWAALAVTAALALAPAQAAAQQGGEPAEPAPVEAEPGFGAGEERPEMEAIDEILEGEAEVLGGATYSYDPGDRRDPFKSLLEGVDSPELRGPRPEGIPGLLIDEIRVSGIYRTAQGRWVAQVQAAANEKGYLIQEGDQLYDGDVVSVTRDEVVFRQIVRDPAALKPFQEVTKRLNP